MVVQTIKEDEWSFYVTYFRLLKQTGNLCLSDHSVHSLCSSEALAILPETVSAYRRGPVQNQGHEQHRQQKRLTLQTSSGKHADMI